MHFRKHHHVREYGEVFCCYTKTRGGEKMPATPDKEQAPAGRGNRPLHLQLCGDNAVRKPPEGIFIFLRILVSLLGINTGHYSGSSRWLANVLTMPDLRTAQDQRARRLRRELFAQR
jgi:hypothetical protein